MSETASRPWHLWVVGLLGLIWNMFGGYDFLMKNTRDQAYVARLTPDAIRFLDTMPISMVGFWALGVWAAVLGSLLLPIRPRFAIWAFAASLVGLAVNGAYTAMSHMPSGQPLGLTLAIWSVAIALLGYALRMRQVARLR